MPDSAQTEFESLRDEMVEQVMLYASLIADETGHSSISPTILDVMRAIPRHEFVPKNIRTMAYVDSPLPIGHGKTISQPFIAALMSDLLQLQSGDRVLEVGTGLGYQAAILATLAKKVYSIEIIEELAREAEQTLRDQGHENIRIGVGDGSAGWAEHAPFDKILVAAAPDLIPTGLLNQLKPGGKMVIPAGIEDAQQLMYVEKDADGRLSTKEILQVRFSTLLVTH